MALQRAGRNANVGLTLRQEVMGGLEAVDWQRFASGFVAGALGPMSSERA